MSGRRIVALFRRVDRGDPARPTVDRAPVHRPASSSPASSRSSSARARRPTIEAVDRQPGRPARGGRRRRRSRRRSASRMRRSTEVARRGDRPGDDRGRPASVAIVLPAELLTTSSPTITVITNGLDPSGEATQLAALQKALARRRRPPRPGGASRRSSTRRSTGRRATTRSRPTPRRSSAFFAYFFVYLLTGVSFLRERTGGTLERLMATPVTRGEIVTGYTLGFGLFADDPGRACSCSGSLGTIHVPAIGPLPAFSIGLGIPIAGSPLLAFVVVAAASRWARSAWASSSRRSPGPSSRSSSSSRS